MNGKLPPLIAWILGGLLAINIALIGVAWNSATDRLDSLEAKVEAVQREYGRITSIESSLQGQSERLRRIEAMLDRLLGRNP